MKTCCLLCLPLFLGAAACASSATEAEGSSNAAVAVWGDDQAKLEATFDYDDSQWQDASPRAEAIRAALSGARVLRDIHFAGGPTFVWATSKDMGRLKCYVYNADVIRHAGEDPRLVEGGHDYATGITELKTWKAPRYQIELRLAPKDGRDVSTLTAACITDDGAGFTLPSTDEDTLSF